VGEDVLLGDIHEPGELWNTRPNLIGDFAPLGLGRVGRFLREDIGDERRDDTAAALAGMGERIAREVNAAALPSRATASSNARDS